MKLAQRLRVVVPMIAGALLYIAGAGLEDPTTAAAGTATPHEIAELAPQRPPIVAASADGRVIAVTRDCSQGVRVSACRIDLVHRGAYPSRQAFTFRTYGNAIPAISGDGSTLVFQSIRNGRLGTSIYKGGKMAFVAGYVPSLGDLGDRILDRRGKSLLVDRASDQRAIGVLSLATHRFLRFPPVPKAFAPRARAISDDGRYMLYDGIHIDRGSRFYVYSRATRRSVFIGFAAQGATGFSSDGRQVLGIGFAPATAVPTSRDSLPLVRYAWQTGTVISELPSAVDPHEFSANGDLTQVAFGCLGDFYLYDIASRAYRRIVKYRPTNADGDVTLDLLTAQGSAFIYSIAGGESPGRILISSTTNDETAAVAAPSC